jgi:hypothetical protein
MFAKRQIRHSRRMPVRRLVLFIALALAAAGTASAFAVGAPQASTALSSSGHTATTIDFLSDLPDLDVAEVAPTTTTSTTVAPPTTVARFTTTTVIAGTTTTDTTTLHPPTTTAPANSAVIDSIVNHYSAAVDYAIGSDDSLAHWVLEPNATAGPATIQLGAHDSSGSHRVDLPSCGRGDQDSYFTAGHHYTIEIVYNDLPDACGEGIPGYWSILRDVTAGSSEIV